MTDELLFPNKATVRVLSPVHIGTGEKLNHLSYARDGSELIVLDANKLTAWACSSEHLAGEFVVEIEAASNASQPDEHRFWNWLSNKGKNPAEFAAYRVRVSVRTSRPLREVMPFIKTAAHQPYLPGSSLKGSLRSSMLRGLLKLQPKLAAELAEMAEPIAEAGAKTLSDELQAEAFVRASVERSKWPNYDLNRALMLGDSNLKSTADLEVNEVKVYSAQTNHTLDGKTWSIFAEMLRPGTQLRVSLTRAAYLLAGQGAARQLEFVDNSWIMVELAALCRAASLDIMEQELKFYRDHRERDVAGWYETARDQLKAITDQRFMLPIGWGSGYDAKTVTDQLGDTVFGFVAENYRNTEGLGRPGNHRGSEWLERDLSPKSRKLVVCETNGELIPVGWIAVKLEAFDEPPAAWRELAERSRITLEALSTAANEVQPVGETEPASTNSRESANGAANEIQPVSETKPASTNSRESANGAEAQPAGAVEPEAISAEAIRIRELMVKRAKQRALEEERKQQAKAAKKKKR
jgi:CRISPR-associated protein Csm5